MIEILIIPSKSCSDCRIGKLHSDIYTDKLCPINGTYKNKNRKPLMCPLIETNDYEEKIIEKDELNIINFNNYKKQKN